jgi:hypothetical protein
MPASLAHGRCWDTESACAKEDKKMRANMKRAALFSTLALSALGVASGCSPSLHGGRTVEAGYVPQALVTYAAEGDTAEGTKYFLVKDTRGLAIYESTPGQDGLLIDAGWRDGNGDHFMAWTNVGDAEYVLVPLDHRTPAYRWVIPRSLYKVEKDRTGIERPKPQIDLEASTKLTPKGPVQ